MPLSKQVRGFYRYKSPYEVNRKRPLYQFNWDLRGVNTNCHHTLIWEISAKFSLKVYHHLIYSNLIYRIGIVYYDTDSKLNFET